MRKNVIPSIIMGGCFILCVLFLSCKKNDSELGTGSVAIESFTPSRGGSTTQILINGKNFITDTSKLVVTINGKRLKIVAANDHQIMAIVPKKTGTGPITITMDGQSVTSVDTFTYQYVRSVSTFAGSGVPGYANGGPADAQFHFYDPGNTWYRANGIVVDKSLNVYVVDPKNNCIRKIDSAGNVSLFAGSPGNAGYADGRGSAARFSLPYSLGIDADDNVYCVDPVNWDIRRISPDGNAVTIGFTKAESWSMTVSKATGDVFYTGIWSSEIYRLTKDLGIHEKIGGGMLWPVGVACDKGGNVYAIGHGDQAIWKFEAKTWSPSVVAGTLSAPGFKDGVGAAARFANPWGLATDDEDNLYVAGNGAGDGGYNLDQSIRMIKAGTWDVTTLAGSDMSGFTNGIGAAATFSGPIGVAVDKNGTVYVIDKRNNVIRKIISE